jgi:hypothetical protein
MTDSSRTQGGLICIGAAFGALLFVVGVLRGSYLALAVPVVVLTLFVLGLVFWVGWTIYTVEVEPEDGADASGPGTVPPSPPGSSSAPR